MNTGFGYWLLDMSLGGDTMGGMLGMASGIFIVLAATTFGSALLYAISGFGFAVLAAPLFLLFLDPARAIQLVIIVSTALSIVVLRGLLPAIAPWLLLRLALGSLVGLPLGLIAFRYADPILVRAAAGAMIFGFAILMAVSRRRPGQPGHHGKDWTAFAMSPGLDLAAGAVSGFASALVGQPGPPVLIYLLLAGAAPRTVRATLLAFFALSYGVTLASHAATIGIPAPTWLAAGILIPFAFFGGLAGRPIGDRLGAEAFAMLAIALLAVAGAYTLGAAAVAFATA
ncbi:MAG: sulfite exporter TauE/SafE family protein [Alphaproteobacteria bacterium]|nr:sulfite exporter TauE/SafE family protein [Alphaproteobacteria bacterium]